MSRLLAAASTATLLAALVASTPAVAQKSVAQTSAAQKSASLKAAPSSSAKEHRVVIQVTQNDPAMMTVALNNAENLRTYYQQKGESVRVELVAYGPGLQMLRSDTSPVRDRLTALVAKNGNIQLSGCGNTLKSQSKQEGKELTLVPEAQMVPTGVGRITDLQEQGWTYIRP